MSSERLFREIRNLLVPIYDHLKALEDRITAIEHKMSLQECQAHTNENPIYNPLAEEGDLDLSGSDSDIPSSSPPAS